jgi:aryl-alcohol dehydrogenase-like predicted oxidoreductase
MINKIILGTAQFGLDYGINKYGELNSDDIDKILEIAHNNQIRILDTAEVYGDALNIIGDFIKKSKMEFKLMSKLNLKDEINSSNIMAHLSKNLEILNSEKFFGYMFHNYKDFKNNLSIYEKLKLLQNNNIIENIGVSLYETLHIEDIVNNFELDFIQVPFNLLDNDISKKEILKKAKSKNIEVHVRSIFLQGLFFGRNNNNNNKIKPLLKYIDNLNEIAKANNSNIESLAIHYPLKKDYIDKVIIGVHNTKQLKDNIDIINSDIDIPESELEKINVKERELLKPYNWI